jgi:hypothetical protein
MTEQKLTSPQAADSVPFELELLSKAHRYQQWVADSVAPFLGNRIMEVGSGTGNMSKWLPLHEKLLLTETDPSLLPKLRKTVQEAFPGDARAEVRSLDLAGDWVGSLVSENLDSIVSFNVLEHIEDHDKAIHDLLTVLQKSKASGPRRLVAFVPAHQWAYGEMDRKFGHYRRYSINAFKQIVEKHLPGARTYFRHFNLIGLPGWFFMGRVLKRDTIGYTAVTSFEKICPFVRGIDDFLQEKLRIGFGQSLICTVDVQ